MKNEQDSEQPAIPPLPPATGSTAGWTRINRTNLPKTGFVVAGSYRDGAWSNCSLSDGDGFPAWADNDRTHWFRLPKPPNDPKLSDGGGLAQPVRAKAARVG